VLATGPGNPPGVRVLTCDSVWFGSRPGQKPDPLLSWQVVTQPRHRTSGIWPGWNWTAVPNLRLLQLWLQSSIWVLIVLWHNQYVDFAELRVLLPPAFRFAIRLIFVEWMWKRGNSKRNLRVFDCDSTNISQIPYLKGGGERARKTAQSTYWSCHNTMRTQIHNWSQICEVEMPGFWLQNWPNCNGPGHHVVKTVATVRFRSQP